MSPSSSGSWPGARGPDIIDLDKYMRGSVRPSSDKSRQGERLIVDGGGIRKPLSIGSSDGRNKRLSHDSGVSDGSYQRHLQRRTHRLHREKRSSATDGNRIRPTRELTSSRTLNGHANSSSSLRAFRAVCEQALLDQKKQIARVAELCERLTEQADQTKQKESVRNERTDKFEHNERFERIQKNERHERIEKHERQQSETSELSSSSRSTNDPRWKNKNRTQECKTYKIIMNKLDELNRLFAIRSTRPQARLPRGSSSTSVSVCDKLTATDPLQRTNSRVLTPTVQMLGARYTSTPNRTHDSTLETRARSSRLTNVRTITNVYTVDIAPTDGGGVRPNVVTKSIVKCDSSGNGSRCCVGDQRCGFELQDPVHLYSQAKQLPGSKASTRRARSVESRGAATSHDARHDASNRSYLRSDRSPSLCAVCRGYLRCLRHCLLAPVLWKVDSCKCS